MNSTKLLPSGRLKEIDAEYSNPNLNYQGAVKTVDELLKHISALDAELQTWKDQCATSGEAIVKLGAAYKGCEEALEKIANQDYRGNRSIESVIAFKALEGLRKARA
ncbi:MAG: hypothetical protein NVS3B3_05970 [Aquirhabdus sp.]